MPEADARFDAPANPGDTLRRVLVIKLGGLGDFVRAMGAMRIIRMAHPSARITLLTTQPFEAMARACPYVDIVETDLRPDDARNISELAKKIRQADYDMVYDLQNNDRTASLFSGLGGKKPKWSGVAEGASHQHRSDNLRLMQSFDRLDAQLRHAGLHPTMLDQGANWTDGAPLLPTFEWVRPAFRDPPRFQPEYFSLYGPYVLLIPGGSANRADRQWPLDSYIELARWLADNDITPVIIGGKAEGDIGVKIERAEQRAKSLVGRTDLFQLVTLSESAKMAIGGDTGPMHVAAAAGAPGVCLFPQDWTPTMEHELHNVWNPQTLLGRTAPRGSHMFVLFAPSLADIRVWDVQHAAIRLGVLPPETDLPPPLEPDAQAEDADEEITAAAEESAAPALAESDDS